MKIGIFGGSFNPPHNMHKNIALKLIEKGYVDKIIYLPTGDNYNKKDLISFQNRYDMVELMIRGNDFLSISNIGSLDSYKYTYQALDYFKKIERGAEIYFICGTDNLKEFHTWQKHLYILENYKLLVIRRDKDDVDNLLEEYSGCLENVIITDVQTDGLSSTKIRNLLKDKKKNQEKLLQYIDEDVYFYITEKMLYE